MICIYQWNRLSMLGCCWLLFILAFWMRLLAGLDGRGSTTVSERDLAARFSVWLNQAYTHWLQLLWITLENRMKMASENGKNIHHKNHSKRHTHTNVQWRKKKQKHRTKLRMKWFCWASKMPWNERQSNERKKMSWFVILALWHNHEPQVKCSARPLLEWQ